MSIIITTPYQWVQLYYPQSSWACRDSRQEKPQRYPQENDLLGLNDRTESLKKTPTTKTHASKRKRNIAWVVILILSFVTAGAGFKNRLVDCWSHIWALYKL